MHDPRLKPYIKKLQHSYTLGPNPTLEMLHHKPEKVLKVLLSTGSEGYTEGVRKIVEICQREGIKYEEQPKAVSKLSVKENTYVIGVFEKYEGEIDKEKNHVVLHNPSDMGNIGTIMRTMVGMGFSELAIVRPAADIFDPKVVRSTMGAFFQVNFRYFDSFEEYVERVGERNRYLFMLGGEGGLEKVAREGKFSLVFGNEGEGLPVELKRYGEVVTLEQSEKIDSLNLAVAAAIAMWEVSPLRMK